MQYSYKKKLKWDINNKKEQDINNIKRHCEERDNQKETIINNTPFPLERHKNCPKYCCFCFLFCCDKLYTVADKCSKNEFPKRRRRVTRIKIKVYYKKKVQEKQNMKFRDFFQFLFFSTVAYIHLVSLLCT